MQKVHGIRPQVWARSMGATFAAADPATVIGATTKRAALARADHVVVLVEGRVAASGPWRDLEPAWGHLAG